MSCPTCDHTMQLLAGEWFWCQRCGTTIARSGHPASIGVPAGVQQARNMLRNSPSVLWQKSFRTILSPLFLSPDEREQLDE